jgi:hypothetical protein
MTDNPTDTILMRHPELPDAEPVAKSLEAFNGVWSKQGWVLVTGNYDFTDLSKDELKEAAKMAGVSTQGTKTELVARLESLDD